jgi:uncharacterized NAD(P)/FAD-binding protein YdhS
MTEYRKIGIVGGGFTGAMLAIHICRESQVSREITIFEPRDKLGAGVAYSSNDPDHRLNGPIELFVPFEDTPHHFQDWYAASAKPDPDAAAQSGFVFPRRECVGDYMQQLVDEHRGANASNSTIEHVKKQIIDLQSESEGVSVFADDGQCFDFDIVFICVAHEKPQLPKQLAAISGDPRVVVDPWDLASISQLPANSDLLIIGSALTTADVIATLLRRGHTGRITAVSRHGLRPREQGKLERIQLYRGGTFDRPPPFLDRHCFPETALDIVRMLRADIEILSRDGREWHIAFDLFREALPTIWRHLSLKERKRALHHLSTFYDVHRFRIAPQNEDIISAAEKTGQIDFIKARLCTAEASPDGLHVDFILREQGQLHHRIFDGIVNCTGPDASVRRSPNPIVKALVDRGLAMPEPTGVGFDVNDDCMSVPGNGEPTPKVRILGPMTRGRFADMTAIPQINVQILDVLKSCGIRPHRPRNGK